MKGHHVILTGPPGIGKTTVVRTVIEELLTRQVADKVKVGGFYTEEVRDGGGRRTGFQVVTSDGRRATLASTSSKSTLRVGNYGVELQEFESLALPALTPFQDTGETARNILVIDEIGKMELFSSAFKNSVENAFCRPNTVVLATIPIPKGKSIPFVEKIRSMPNATLFTVSPESRPTVMENLYCSYSQT